MIKNSDSFKTPILLITFNRIETTKRVFEKIKEQRPEKLYVASDGARGHKQGEDAKVQEVRSFLNESVDWKCQVKTLFQEQNLGCNHGPHNAITWFFENEEEGIILEDDCLPAHSFFPFCESLLEHYRNDLRVFTVGGHNSLDTMAKISDSYFFTKLPMIWGWATWRNRWQLNLETLKNFEQITKNPLVHSITKDIAVNKVILDNAKLTYTDKADAWDYIWTFTSYLNNALSIVPSKNLIENIGFGPDSTHTSAPHNAKKTKTYILESIIKHPNIMLPEFSHDNYVYKDVMNWKSLSEKISDPDHLLKVLKSKF